jgi:hypothetical protein
LRAGAARLRDRKDRQQDVVRMAAAARIGVVAFEIAAGDAVGEGGKLRQRPVRRADHRCAVRDLRRASPPPRAMRRGSSSNAAIAQPMVSMIRRLQSCTTSAGRSVEGRGGCEFGDAFGAVVHGGLARMLREAYRVVH